MTPSMGRIGLLAAASSLALISPAFAQSAADAAGDEEIVVTAQKRVQTLREVPQSVSVLSGEALEQQQADNFADYLGLIPGLSLESSTPGESRVTLRGINTGGVASTVGVYVDETPFGSSSGLANGAILAADFDTFDMARLEVLRGPQGTLWGASSLGGVLRFVTTPPELGELRIRAQAGLETVDGGDVGYSGRGAVNVPVGESIAVRATGFYRLDGGFVDSIGTGGSDIESNLNEVESYGGRVSALAQLNDRLSVRVTGLAQNLRADASSAVEVDPLTRRPLYGGLTQSQFLPEYHDTRYRLYNATAELDLGFASLTSSTSYGTFRQTFATDYSPLLGDLVTELFGDPVTRRLGLQLGQRTTTDKFTQEVRLASPSAERLEWLVGAYFTDEDSGIRQQFTPRELDSAALATGIPELGLITLDSKYREYAGFANLTWRVTDRFEISAGGRLSRNEQSADQVVDGLLSGSAVYNVAPTDENVFTYSLSTRLELSDDSALYARMASGYRPGGPNALPPAAPPGTPESFDSDTLVSYEVGLKTDLLDDKLSLDLSAFYLDWKDIQLFASVNDTGVNTNGGSASSRGAELTAIARPTRGLSVTTALAYTKAKLTEDTPPIVGGLDGDRLPYSPEWTAAVSADYEWGLGASATAFVGGTLRFVGEQSADFDLEYRLTNGRQPEIPSYQTVDLRAGVTTGRWTFEAFAKNLANARGYTSFYLPAGFAPNGAATAGHIRPRVVGLTIGADF